MNSYLRVVLNSKNEILKMKVPSKKTVLTLIVFGLLKKVFLILWIFYF